MGTSKLSGKPDKLLEVTCDGLASHSEGVVMFVVASCYRNQDKLWECGPLGSCANFTFFIYLTPEGGGVEGMGDFV